MSSPKKLQRAIVAILMASVLLIACLSPATDEPVRPTTSSGKGGWVDWDGEGGWSGGERAMTEGGEAVVLEAEALAPKMGAADGAPPAATAALPERNASQSSLRAGEVDDNANWDDYLLYRMNYAGPTVHDRDVSERYVVTVNDQNQRPLLGATVTFYADGRQVFSGQTYATGQVLFFPRALDVSDEVTAFDVVVEKDDVRHEATLVRGETFELTVGLAHTGRPDQEPVHLDVLFLIDSTGSMSDEIAKLQESIQQMAVRIDRLPTQPQVRFAMTIYRDRGDLFVSRTFDFTPDVDQFSEALAEVRAEGGGDYPESLNEGLHRAIHAPEWRGEDTVQLIFLVADAPPHLDYEQDYDYADEMAVAAERGIKIFPIASSGLDDQGEYIYRQIAQFTQGRFIFLTYSPGGGPGDSTTHHVDDYSVQKLDDLVVRLVEEELAHQQ